MLPRARPEPTLGITAARGPYGSTSFAARLSGAILLRGRYGRLRRSLDPLLGFAPEAFRLPFGAAGLFPKMVGHYLWAFLMGRRRLGLSMLMLSVMRHRSSPQEVFLRSGPRKLSYTAGKQKKPTRLGTQQGVKPRRLTRQRASRHCRAAPHLVIRLRAHAFAHPAQHPYYSMAGTRMCLIPGIRESSPASPAAAAPTGGLGHRQEGGDILAGQGDDGRPDLSAGLGLVVRLSNCTDGWSHLVTGLCDATVNIPWHSERQ